MERDRRVTLWLWRDSEPRPGWQQMAIDRALAARGATDGTEVFRVYRWQSSTVSFGANEAACRTWNRQALRAASVPCVRRPTGGRGVWHDAEDLTYAYTGSLRAAGGLRLAYRHIHEHLARALSTLGLDATLAPTGSPASLRPGACFEQAVGGEVLVAGRKTIGSAQAVFGDGLLQHGAIATAERSTQLARFRLNGTAGPAVADTAPLDAARLEDALIGIWRATGGEPIPSCLRDWAVIHADAYIAGFQDENWTWRR